MMTLLNIRQVIRFITICFDFCFVFLKKLIVGSKLFKYRNDIRCAFSKGSVLYV